jgi:hypothetical protein
VFADMARGFEAEPILRGTSDTGSRCASDLSDAAGLACWRTDAGMEVCNVGCGATPREAMAAARSRCEAKHLRACPITAAIPVQAPR